MDIKKNTILLTGGTSGIGLELLQRFYQYDNNIIVVSSSETKLEKVKQLFPEITTIHCDLASSIDVQYLIGECNEKFNINILINNAGVQYNYDFNDEANGFEKIAREIQINLTSPMQLIHGLLPNLLKKQNAAIINVSSGLAIVPKKQAPIYCATKAAVHQATVALRHQLKDTSIKFFEILPPLVETAMTEGRGTGKITTKQLVNEFMVNFKKDKLESNIGKVKILRIIHRIAPQLAQKIMNRSSV
jgi:uncharacterized oxidoreductase